MNEHSSGTRAEVPPSATDRGTNMKRPLTENDVRGPGVLIGREGEIIAVLRAQLEGLKAWRTTEGNARESARDAGGEIHKEVGAPDQGSVRNATDMRERCAKVCERHATYAQCDPPCDPGVCVCPAMLCAAAIRALPDQKD